MCSYFYQNGIYDIFQKAWTQTCTEKGCSKRINRNYAYGDQFQYTIHKLLISYESGSKRKSRNRMICLVTWNISIRKLPLRRLATFWFSWGLRWTCEKIYSKQKGFQHLGYSRVSPHSPVANGNIQYKFTSTNDIF